jgi:hypothetical protein
MITEDVTMFFDYGIHLPTKTLWIGGENGGCEIDGATAERVLKGVHILGYVDNDKPIQVLLHSGGGNTDHGMAIYNALVASPCQIHIHVHKFCESIATWILQAGDRRTVGPHSQIMVHAGSITMAEPENQMNLVNIVEQMAKENTSVFVPILQDKLQIAMADDPHSVARILNTKLQFQRVRPTSEITHKIVCELLILDNWFTAAESVVLNLADEIK